MEIPKTSEELLRNLIIAGKINSPRARYTTENMAFKKYRPDFHTPEEVKQLLVDQELFKPSEVSIRSIIMCLEVLADKHGLGKGARGYEVKDEHLPVIAQYIDRKETVSCNIDIA